MCLSCNFMYWGIEEIEPMPKWQYNSLLGVYMQFNKE